MNSIDVINNAVTLHKKICFVYNNYGTDFKLHRRRTDVKILDKPARELLNQNNFITDFVGNLNLPKHMAEHIYMFSGKSIRVKFWTDDFMMNCLVDWFGKDFNILQNKDDTILVEVNVNEHAIKYWVMQFGEFVEVVTPVTLREEIFKTAEKIMNTHR